MSRINTTRTQIDSLLSGLEVDKPSRVPIVAGWEYLRRELYVAAKDRRFWLHMLIDKEREELILIRLR